MKRSGGTGCGGPKAAIIAIWLVLACHVPIGPALAQGSNLPVIVDNRHVPTTLESSGLTREAAPGSERFGHSDPTFNPHVYAEMAQILFATLVIAILLESALALIFNWRPFLMYFDRRGVKSVIALAVGWATASVLNLDIVQRLYVAINGPTPGLSVGGLGEFLTGLILAGGSAAVYNILHALGFRQFDRAAEVTPKPATDKAWISVRLKRVVADGPVSVLLSRNGGTPELIGVIRGTRRPPAAWAWAFTDWTRFPTVAGYELPTGTEIALTLKGKNEANQTVESRAETAKVGARAIIDFEVAL
ncbi:hypothetical protein SAMN06295912_11195 [Sphingomonas laterariae]|uniref:Uncharacterized protein n=1 Tax=Edaphosphingomonas laterariae TaxID=861865 RepID=A0A239G9M7_9SPHN|nr:hypothetical protein [Sphingomonas laterariae]SNS65801.1 hypothetical protein SAMN06295912_11195 [Sphingomonas laterariae]